MKKLAFLILLISPLALRAQLVLKENLSPKESLFWDFNKTQIQAVGSYYIEEREATKEKHGKWTYYDRFGVLEEERNYYKDMLHGKGAMYFPNKKIKQEGYFVLGRQDSIYREWNENGKLAVQGNYKLNAPNGKWTYFYLDGREKSIEEIKGEENKVIAFWLPDSLHTQTIIEGNGEMTVFHTTGAVKEWYNFKNGLKDGPFEEISPYGYITLKGFFKSGEKDSTWTYAYYTGDTEKISNYRNGKLNGEYNYFYDKGQLNVKGFYEDGKKIGKWIWYTNKGTKDMEGVFENDLQQGDWTYYFPTGELSFNAKYVQGLKTGLWKYFYRDGKKFKEGSFKNDLKDGHWQTWYENGTLLMTGFYKEGKEEGVWENFWDNGNIKNTSTFKSGLLNGDWTSSYPSGNLKLTGKYEDGLQVDAWSDYFENGKTKDVVTYKIFREKSKIDYGIMKDREHLESKKDGHAISYSAKDFAKTEEGHYNEGLKDREWIAYYPGGKSPAVVSVYKKGELNGTMKQFDRNGNLLQEIDYKDGLKHGRFIVYDSRGALLIEKTFENGMEVIKGQENKSGSFSPK